MRRLICLIGLVCLALAAPAARAEDGVTPTARPAPDQRQPFEPLGFAGGAGPSGGGLPIEDRWRIGFPSWERYAGASGESPYRHGAPWNPYEQNVLKGDYPILGDDIFLEASVASDTLFEARAFPVPSSTSTNRPRSQAFFGDFDQMVVNQNFVVSAEVFKGDSAFKPKEFALRATPVFNLNWVDFEEVGLVDVDVRRGHDRLDHHVGMQELFTEVHLADLSPSYDFLTVIAGIQPFTSDFRGFLYSDDNLGVRLQGNFAANRYQTNLAWFHQLEKETNSGLNTFDSRDQNVFIANVFAQDFVFEGYTAELSWHYNRDHSGTHYDTNGFLVRPAKIGSAAGSLRESRDKDLDVHYLGVGGDGHIGRLNITNQYYLALGRDSRNEIAGRAQEIQAHFFAVEGSVDVDWLRLKSSFLYSSGDKNPQSGTATGFDTIFDNAFFAGAGFSYFNRQGIPLVPTGVNLVNRLSLVPDLRSSKTEGQSNFVNPGLYLANVGASARVTPKLFVDVNVNFLWFAETEPIELVLQQSGIKHDLGVDTSVGVQYRPLLTENVIFTVGASAFTPWEGFRQIYAAHELYSTFAALTLTY